MTLEQRREANKNLIRRNNADLYAGSSMYYYCRTCGTEIRLPEDHAGGAPRQCYECEQEKVPIP